MKTFCPFRYVFFWLNWGKKMIFGGNKLIFGYKVFMKKDEKPFLFICNFSFFRSWQTILPTWGGVVNLHGLWGISKIKQPCLHINVFGMVTWIYPYLRIKVVFASVLAISSCSPSLPVSLQLSHTIQSNVLKIIAYIY